MSSVLDSTTALAGVVKRLARRAVAAGSNRLELLTLELQEERERIVQTLLLVLAVATLGLLTAMTVSALVVVLLWSYSPWLALAVLAGLYAAGTTFCAVRLSRLQREWPFLPKSLEQWQKDQTCIETLIG